MFYVYPFCGNLTQIGGYCWEKHVYRRIVIIFLRAFFSFVVYSYIIDVFFLFFFFVCNNDCTVYIGGISLYIRCISSKILAQFVCKLSNFSCYSWCYWCKEKIVHILLKLTCHTHTYSPRSLIINNTSCYNIRIERFSRNRLLAPGGTNLFDKLESYITTGVFRELYNKRQFTCGESHLKRLPEICVETWTDKSIELFGNTT